MTQTDTSKTIRVFLVDDHRTVLWGLQRLIESEGPGMEVVGAATTIDEAIAQLPAVKADVILLDLDLGGKSGIDVLPTLREISGGARVLVLTGMRDGRLHEQAIVAGACGVVTKESSADTILKAIGKAYVGEMWLDRTATARIFMELSRRGRSELPDPVELKIRSLTARERQIITELTADAGASTRAIASALCMSEHTLRNHLSSIYDKLGVSSRVELWAFATRHGLSSSAPPGVLSA
ncbi:MAG TPA: response regulator transcription factor [Usitatibacter sp.]|nr:response regulator transcription factor [Usitatibacter sp.]